MILCASQERCKTRPVIQWEVLFKKLSQKIKTKKCIVIKEYKKWLRNALPEEKIKTIRLEVQKRIQVTPTRIHGE